MTGIINLNKKHGIMCKFLSAIGIKNGDIICNPNIDSHEDLIKMNDLKESKIRNWTRLEYYPDNENEYHLIEKYKLHVDDDIAIWITDSLKKKWIKKLNAKLSRIIIKENKYILQGNTYILSGNILIEKLIYCRIFNAGHSTIEYAWYSTIKDAWYSTIKDAGYSTIKDAGYSTIKDAGHSTIEYAGHSTIEYAGYSTIKYAGHSTIKDAGHSTIEYAGYSTIKDAGHSTIKGIKYFEGKPVNNN